MSEPAGILCPACGATNPAGAVFCQHPECHKALGEFRYALEEFKAKTRWHEALADRAASFIGRPQFLALHAAWFLVWIVLNAGLFALVRKFDEFPYGLLGIVLAIEAIFITGFLLISSNRQSAYSDLRAELDYEVNVRSYRELKHLAKAISEMEERMLRLEETITRPVQQRAGTQVPEQNA